MRLLMLFQPLVEEKLDEFLNKELPYVELDDASAFLKEIKDVAPAIMNFFQFVIQDTDNSDEVELAARRFFASLHAKFQTIYKYLIVLDTLNQEGIIGLEELGNDLLPVAAHILRLRMAQPFEYEITPEAAAILADDEPLHEVVC